MKVVTDISKCRFGEPKGTGYYGSIQREVDVVPEHKHSKANKELCRRQNTLWNLTHDVDIECIQVGKG